MSNDGVDNLRKALRSLAGFAPLDGVPNRGNYMVIDIHNVFMAEQRAPGLILKRSSDPSKDTDVTGNFVRETEPMYATERICFICGVGDEDEPLAGSSPLCDWVHLGCLKQPLVWD